MANWFKLLDTNEIVASSVKKNTTFNPRERTCGRTRYFLDEDEGKDIFILDRRLTNLSDQKEYIKSKPTLLESNANDFFSHERMKRISNVQKALHDCSFDYIVTEAAQRQSENISTRIMSSEQLAEEAISPGLLRNIDVQTELGGCKNIRAGEVMISYPSIELGELPKKFVHEYVPIAKNSERGQVIQPCFPLGNTSEELFSETDEYSHQRFDVVLAVATALCIASGANWSHRRLSTANILVQKDWVLSAMKSTGGASHFMSHEKNSFHYRLEDLVKVINFRCPVTNGCAIGCTDCKQFLSSARLRYGSQYIEEKYSEHLTKLYPAFPGSKTMIKPISFSQAFGSANDAVQNGSGADVTAFASFVLWMYAGVVLSKESDFSSFNYGKKHLYRLPWPMRYIVLDAFSARKNIVSLNATVDYLSALRERRIRPHTLTTLLVPDSSPLRVTALYAALCGSRSDEPQAMMHFGNLCQREAYSTRQAKKTKINEANKESTKTRTKLGYTAYGFYASAVIFGEPLGLMGMAQVQAAWVDNQIPRPNFPHIDFKVNIRTVLRLILQGAKEGVEDALFILENVKEPGFTSACNLVELKPNEEIDADEVPGNVSGDFARDEIRSNLEMGSELERNDLDVYDSKCQQEERRRKLFDGIVNVAKCWRRGTAGLESDIPEARAWLELTFGDEDGYNDFEYSAGKLELGLLERQVEESELGMYRAFHLISDASTSHDSIVKSCAQFWLGMWHHQGLSWRGVEIVSKDDVIAGKMFEESAKSASPNIESMTFFARFLKNGFGKVLKDEFEADRWYIRARKEGSMMAHCKYAYDLEDEARELFVLLKLNVRERSKNQTISVSRKSFQSNESFYSNNARSQSSEKKLSSTVHISHSSTRTGFNIECLDLSKDAEIKEAIEMKLRRARRVLVDGIARMKNEDPEQGYNPIPYWLIGRLILSNLTIWSSCAKSVVGNVGKIDASEKADLERKLRQDAFNYLREAKNMNSNEKWKAHRVNFAAYDQQWIEAARKKLEEASQRKRN